jgi:hypothetical protein
MKPAYRERPVQFGANRGLFGILCTPAVANPEHQPIVVMPNSGLIHRIGTNRIHVLLARALAEQGIRSLRMDLSGIGESERRTDVTSLDESVHRDLSDAIDFLAAKHEGQSFAVLGLCSGAYDGLQIGKRDRRVVGVVAIDVFGTFRTPRHLFNHYRKRLLRKQSWRNAVSQPGAAAMALLERWREDDDPVATIAPDVRPLVSRSEMESILGTMNQRRVHSLFLFTSGLEDNYNYEHQFRNSYPTHVQNGRISYGFFPQSNHTFVRPSDRLALVAKVTAWFADTSFERVSPAAEDSSPEA